MSRLVQWPRSTTTLKRTIGGCVLPELQAGNSVRLSVYRVPRLLKGKSSFPCLQSIVRHTSTCPTTLKANTVSNSGMTLDVEWSDGSKSRFHGAWLRHNCHCQDCKQLDSGQKTMDVVSIPPDVSVASANISGAAVELEWSCGHVGRVPLQYLHSNCYSQEARHRRAAQVQLTEECTARSIPALPYSDVVQSQRHLLKWLTLINQYGVCLLTGVPLEENMVTKVAELIDKPQHTIYGHKFDVVNTPRPINIAYSNVGLDLHMDLVYYESPPGLQLLFARRFDQCVEGGESVFVDAFRVAEDFRQKDPDHFQTLVEVPATFQKVHYDREAPVHMTFQRPHIVLNSNKEIVNVNWAPPFEGPLSVPEADVERYYAAYQSFAKCLQVSSHALIYRLQEGDVVVFNNRRMLHGRHSFSLNGGVRLLEGCYIHIDHFKSKVQVLSNTVGDGRPAKRVGNQDWF
ncbi:probable gamma-butyrobetaine dioxygenase [Haliotis rufescens]|uniref:probable gamma-butyrobetaine dioxygenase n=1 Tax=Haliotis rufescens TaxID=6454 RepID=UPI00201F84CE|nr:probable gamma-butyrobetaine dioxygenase [Haliotis rufescens]XP_046337690.2 probable gamma-butyrobetaine dioxygenase [Haliotis rufescens]